MPGPGGAVQAPHIVVTVFMRGLLKHLITRVYFPDDPANAEDAVLKLVPPERRATLVEVTEHGADVLAEIRATRGPEAGRIFARLSPADRAELASILSKLRD